MGYSVKASGPLFDGRADRAVAAFLKDAVRKVADEAQDKVEMNLMGSIRENHRVYTSKVHVEPEGSTAVVTDGGVVYGPWLEGVGSRNATTRFKGYSSFRRARNEMERIAPEIAQAVLPKYLARMN